MKRFRKKSAGVLLLVFLLLFSFALELSAAETNVYVAGNPDLYPIEYYNKQHDRYEGLMPELYALLSEKTGYTFHYVHAGDVNEQQRLVKNCQVDMVSAYLPGEIGAEYLKAPQTISGLTVGGEEQTVYIAFSAIASDEMIAEISRALSEISGETKLTLVATHTMKHGINRTFEILFYLVLSLLVLFLTIVFLRLFFRKKKKGSRREDLMIDPRFGIGNDQYYVYCFDHLISDQSKCLYYLAYIAFDEEHFNQRYGAGESKSIQRYVAEFLNRKTGPTDYLCLISDGIFVCLCQNSNKEETERRVESVMAELDGYLSQFREEYAGLFHAGVCMLEENPGCSSEAALYHAKQGYLYAVSRKIRFAFSSKHLVAETLQNERIYQQITQAIRDGEFQVYLQYIVDRQGNIAGAEAVSRWQNPREGLLSPAKYIEKMNQTDAVTMHDYSIFSQVCRQMEKWEKSGFHELFLSCNFTRYSVTSPDFPDRIREIADRYSFCREHLFFELTEDSLSHNPELLKKNIETCKELGFMIALDDIGSGYTSLSDLYSYPIDLVKVERDIVLNAETRRGKMLLDGLVRLAHSMNIMVLCEGVETEAQKQTVHSAECDLVQGYYYSRVLPLKEAEKFLREKKR